MTRPLKMQSKPIVRFEWRCVSFVMHTSMWANRWTLRLLGHISRWPMVRANCRLPAPHKLSPGSCSRRLWSPDPRWQCSAGWFSIWIGSIFVWLATYSIRVVFRYCCRRFCHCLLLLLPMFFVVAVCHHVDQFTCFNRFLSQLTTGNPKWGLGR